jgi:hypothetical protein
MLVSAVGVACIAVVMAGVVWYERFVVVRLARRRTTERRLVRLWASADLRVPEDVGSRRLAAAIERAVVAGDLAASYEARWREEAKRGESPFQLKRSRMEAATLRYTQLLDTVAGHATGWLDKTREPEPWHRQRWRSIEKLAEHLVTRSREGVLSDLAGLDATIDLLENALVNLCAHRSVAIDPHPFR